MLPPCCSALALTHQLGLCVPPAHLPSTPPPLLPSSPPPHRAPCPPPTASPRHRYTGMTVIELGSGPGLAGLLAAKLGARVVITDKAVVLPLIQDNIRLNGIADTPTATCSGTATVCGCICLYVCSDLLMLLHLLQGLFCCCAYTGQQAGTVHCAVMSCHGSCSSTRVC